MVTVLVVASSRRLAEKVCTLADAQRVRTRCVALHDDERNVDEGTRAVVIVASRSAVPLAIAECARIRAEHGRLPIFFSVSAASARRAALRAGATEFFLLDDALPELANRLQRIEPNGKSVPSAPVHLRLDRVARRLWLDGREVQLSCQKFELLRYFIDHAGQAVSARQLVHEGLLLPSQSKRYKGLIHELRARLGSAGPLLRSLPGYGYRLELPRGASNATREPGAYEALVD